MRKPYLLISGATGGLGSAFAVECAQRGYDLVLTDVPKEAAQFTAALASAFSVDVHYFSCDLTSPQERMTLYKTLDEEGFSFWGLINVAGIDYEGAFLSRRRDEICQILRLNIEAAVELTHTILARRVPNKRFMLINVCSLAAFFPMPYKALYAASKRFLLDFTLSLAEEISSFGSATALCPAGLPTNPDVMRAIFAQGFWGKMTAMDTNQVARLTINAALKGKKVVIPGFLNLWLQKIGSLLPRTIIARLLGKRWKQSCENTVFLRYPLMTDMVESTCKTT